MSLITSEFKSMLRSYMGIWVRNTLVVAFIFLLLNIFLGVSLYLNTLSDQVQGKLGVYLYLNDIPGKEVQVYNQVLRMKKDLEQHGATINFVSKDDALGFLAKKLPNLTENFDKFNIENPLQSTLYITFDNKNSYEYVKQVIDKNKVIIDNYNDIEKGTSLHAQNNRVLGIMNLSKFVKVVFYTMVGLLAILIFVLLRHFLKSLSHYFHQDLYRKKIMGASKTQIIMPLVWYTLLSIVLGVILAGGLTIILGFILNYYIFESFGINSMTYIFSLEFLIALGVVLGIVIISSLVVAYRYFYKVDKELK